MGANVGFSVATLSERFAFVYGRRPVQAYDLEADQRKVRERRFLIGQATNRADRLFQIQIIYLCGLIFSLLIAPPWVGVAAYSVIQLSEVHALIVFRRLLVDAQNPAAPLDSHKGPVARYELGSAAAISVALLLAYMATRTEWTMGILALWGLGAIYFVPVAKHDVLTLYGTLCVLIGAMTAAVLIRAFGQDTITMMSVAPPLALVAFTAVTSFATAANARLEHMKRLDHEEVLEHAVARVNAESDAKSALLAQLSHEVRTPLNDVLGAAELLRAKDMPDDQRTLVDLMRKSGVDLVELLDRMLEMSAAEIGAISIRRAPAVLDRLISEEVALFQGKARAAGIDLKMASGFCDMPRQMDEVRIRQCIANLISNAIDHSKGDQVVVSCAVATGTAITIRIADNGRGVPTHRRKLVFQPFGDKGLEGAYEGQGAGLGLALSRSIARAMGGNLELLDFPGPGSVFELQFAAPAV